jgi:hypothetical protein
MRVDGNITVNICRSSLDFTAHSKVVKGTVVKSISTFFFHHTIQIGSLIS